MRTTAFLGADPEWFLRGGGGGGGRWYFDQITILTLRIRIDKRLIRFYTVTHPTILHTFTGIKMDLLKNFKYTIKGKRYEYLE